MPRNSLLKKFNKKSQEIIACTEREIEWYNVKGKMACAMLEIAELGFEFCGHGMCFGKDQGLEGGEDFSFLNNKLYVIFRRNLNSKCLVSIYKVKSDVNDFGPLFRGNVDKALEYIKKNK